jgi:hypothetical protein
MSRGTPTTPFRIDPALKARAQARATREGTTLTAIVVAAIEAYAAGDTEPKPTTTQDQAVKTVSVGIVERPGPGTNDLRSALNEQAAERRAAEARAAEGRTAEPRTYETKDGRRTASWKTAAIIDHLAEAQQTETVTHKRPHGLLEAVERHRSRPRNRRRPDAAPVDLDALEQGDDEDRRSMPTP